jgi:glycosyltransferase involved in cell wall biosynthesis
MRPPRIREDHPTLGVRADPDREPALRPDVTVVVPTRNRAAYLPRCVAAVLGQQGVTVELIVVDDASTDETPAVLDRMRDGCVRVVRVEERHGVSKARNLGIALASAPWIAFLDDDDLWAPHKLRRQLDAAEAAKADFVCGAAVVVDEENAVVRYGHAPDPGTLARDLLVRNVVPGGCSNVIARTSLVTRLGGFDPRLTQLADRDLWIRLAQVGRAAACDQIVVAYLLHSGNMRQQSDLDGIAELEYLLDKHKDARRHHHVRTGRAGGYRYFARAQLDARHRRRAARMFATLAVRERSLSDAGRAVASLLIGRRPGHLAARHRPQLRHLSEPEIAWLRARSPEEIEWLRALTDSTIDTPSPKGATQATRAAARALALARSS